MTMKLRVVASDGATFEADTHEDLVIQMKLDMWIPPKTKEQYMKDVAKRTEIFNGETITYSDCRTFLRELLRIGVLKEMWERGCKLTFLRRKG